MNMLIMDSPIKSANDGRYERRSGGWMKGEGDIMEQVKVREKFGNYFAVRAVAFVLCALLAAVSLWFFPHGMIELHKPGVNVSNVKIAELLSGEDYVDSNAFRVTSMYELNSLLFGFEKAAKLPALDAVLDALGGAGGVDSPVKPANDEGGESANDGVAAEAIVRYVEQLSYDDYRGSDLYYIVSSAVDAWVNNGQRYFTYQLSGGAEKDKAPLLEFDFERVKDNEQLFRNNEPVIALSSGSVAEQSAGGAFFAAYPEQTKVILSLWKEMNAENSRTAAGNLDADGLRYFATDGKTVVTNVAALENKTDFGSADFASDPAYLSVRGGSVSDTSAALKPVMDSWQVGFGPNSMSADIAWSELSLFLSYPETVIAERSAAYDVQVGVIRENFVPAAVCAALAFVLLILLIVWTGRKVRGRSFALDSPVKPANDGRRLYLWDRFFMEGQIVLIVLCVLFAVLSVDWFASASSQPMYYYWPGGSTGGFTSPGSLLLMAEVAALAAGAVWCLLSIVRNLKALTFVQRSLIGLICLAVFRGVRGLCLGIRAAFEERNPLTKSIGLVAALWVLTAICAGLCGIAVGAGGGYYFVVSAVFLFVILAAALWFTVRWVARYGRLRRGVEEVSSGNVNYRIEVPEGSRAEFDVLSRRVNEISKAIETAVASELKNQRLKTDLISNVSHDLKTPLTSIITYTDLLKKEGLRSKHAAEYLDVLEEKGQRLKKLTDDLFEAAKASSGAVPANVERVDLLSLVRQEIAETETLFAANGLDVITDAPDEHYYVSADGNLLWRVMENIFRNAGKYALSGSRVYIDLRRETKGQGGSAERVVFTMKNISAVKLNIPADELMERFQRGDENRTTEGSGLGLAIARDLVRLQHGHFDIIIDGDLFKAVIEFAPFEE
jgi:signal transduction histidine kinase